MPYPIAVHPIVMRDHTGFVGVRGQMTDRQALRLIPGGAVSAFPVARRTRAESRSAHLYLVGQDARDRDTDRDDPIHRGREALRPLRRPVDVALRLAIWAEAARAAGDTDRADRLCLMAWDAYDRPVRDPAPEAKDG